MYFNKYVPPFFSFLCIFVTVKPKNLFERILKPCGKVKMGRTYPQKSNTKSLKD